MAAGAGHLRSLHLKGTMRDTSLQLDVVPLAPALGAEIRGIEIGPGLDDAAFEALRAVLDRYSVIVVRDQTQLTADDYIAFARRFGLRFNIQEFLRPYLVEGHPEIYRLTNIVKDGRPWGLADAGRIWHTDGMFTLDPDLYTLLHAIEVPHKNGNPLGDTIFASTTAAYDALPGAVKARIDEAEVVQSYALQMEKLQKRGSLKRAPLTEDQKKELRDVVHPLIELHPRTGRRVLNVSESFSKTIVGFPQAESDRSSRVPVRAHRAAAVSLSPSVARRRFHRVGRPRNSTPRPRRLWRHPADHASYRAESPRVSVAGQRERARVQMNYDLLLKDATIVDGTGAPSFHGDIGIADGIIIDIGDLAGKARRRINLDGIVAAPGVLDIHTHYDAQLCWDSVLSGSTEHGTTTVLQGNCAVGVAPCRAEDREPAMQDLVVLEGMSYDVMRQGIDWGFETFPQYLDFLRKRGLAVNVMALVPLSQLRRYKLGDEASERAATAAEREAMAGDLREALEAGAFGFSSSSVKRHVGYKGRPLAARLADVAELTAYAGVMKEAGRGLIQANVIERPAYVSDDELEMLEMLSTVSGGRPVTCSGATYRQDDPSAIERMLERLEPLNSARGGTDGAHPAVDRRSRFPQSRRIRRDTGLQESQQPANRGATPRVLRPGVASRGAGSSRTTRPSLHSGRTRSSFASRAKR